MAEKKVTILNPNKGVMNTVIAMWDAFVTSDTAQPWASADYADKTVQAFGGWGGGSLTVQGSNDPRVLTDPANAKWGALYDLDNNVLTFSADSLPKLIRENPYWIRVLPSGTLTATYLTITGKRAP